MDLIKLYYNSADVQPKVLLHHFLRYMGFFVEGVSELMEAGEEQSVADIYIISNCYMADKGLSLDIKELDKSILVLLSPWKVTDSAIRTVNYLGCQDKNFLLSLVKVLNSIFEKEYLLRDSLLKSDLKWRQIGLTIADAYNKVDLLRASLFSRCFYKQEMLFERAFVEYREFIRFLEKQFIYTNNDLLEYAILYAKYEFDLICKNNSYRYIYSEKALENKCNDLLTRYKENEELYLLKADIQFELKGNWLQACDDYGENHISHCAYANYKRGKIFRTYLDWDDKAIVLLKSAINKKKDYVYAMYQLGACYEAQRKYQDAIAAYKRIRTILQNKFKNKCLDPMELEYLYKAIMKIAVIYKVRLDDYVMAYRYNELADEIRENNVISGYLEQVWGDEPNKESIFKAIDAAVKEHVNLKLENIY